jgi:hypothetical protein
MPVQNWKPVLNRINTRPVYPKFWTPSTLELALRVVRQAVVGLVQPHLYIFSCKRRSYCGREIQV